MALSKGFLFLFMESMARYDDNILAKFVEIWVVRRVFINGISFHLNKEIITMVIGLSMDGQKWRKETKDMDETNMNRFFEKNE